jgi:enoyl-CoA hydratase/carnithine racemase
MDVRELKTVRYEFDKEGIVTITINRPEIKNALSFWTLLELYHAFETADNDPAAMAIILTGAKKSGSDPSQEAFSSGGYFNLAELENMDPEDKAQIDLTDVAQKKLCLRLFQIEKPIIAAINGLAIGGGFTIPFTCADLIYVSEHAWARFPFVRLGITPELASSYLLPRYLGMQKTKELFFFGEKLGARELLEYGMVNKVLPHDELLPYAREMALKLVLPHGAPLAVRWTKKVMHQPLIEAMTAALDRENEMLNRAFGTADFIEAIDARIQKRDPVFKGK